MWSLRLRRLSTTLPIDWRLRLSLWAIYSVGSRPQLVFPTLVILMMVILFLIGVFAEHSVVSLPMLLLVRRPPGPFPAKCPSVPSSRIPFPWSVGPCPPRTITMLVVDAPQKRPLGKRTMLLTKLWLMNYPWTPCLPLLPPLFEFCAIVLALSMIVV